MMTQILALQELEAETESVIWCFSIHPSVIDQNGGTTA